MCQSCAVCDICDIFLFCVRERERDGWCELCYSRAGPVRWQPLLSRSTTAAVLVAV